MLACGADQNDAPPPKQSTKIVDIDMTIGGDGLPLIVYRAGDDIKVRRCNDFECESSDLAPKLDQGISVEATTAADGVPLIAYISRHAVRTGEFQANVAHCRDAGCREYVTSVIVNARSVSITLGSDGLGILSYVTNDNLLGFAHCVDTDCRSATTSTAPVPGPVISHALPIGGDGLPFVTAAVGPVALEHHTVRCTNVKCTDFDTFTPGTAGFVKDATVDQNGLPVVAYNRFDVVKLLRCEDFSCSNSSVQEYRDIGDKTQDTGLVIWDDGSTLVSMVDIWEGTFEVASCEIGCRDPVAQTIDTFEPDGPRVGQLHALATGGDGLLVIAYATPDGELRVVHCLDVGCADRTVQGFRE